MAELETLRKGYAAVLSPEGAHLGDERWMALAGDELNPAERADAIDHILSCAECTLLYRGVLGVRMEAGGFDPGAPAGRVDRGAGLPGWRRILIGVAAAAAVVAALAVVRPLLSPGPGPAPGKRTITLRAARTPEGPSLVAPLGPVAEPPDSFSWRPVPEARGYVVELLDGDGELLWRSGEVAGAMVPWPATVERPPGRYYWRVLSIPEEGGAAVGSPLESFDLGATSSLP